MAFLVLGLLALYLGFVSTSLEGYHQHRGYSTSVQRYNNIPYVVDDFPHSIWSSFLARNRQEAASMILEAFDSGSVGIDGVDPDAIVHYVVERDRTRETARIRSDWRKQVQKERHDLGVREQSFYAGQLVMLYDAKAAKKKLHPAWRGPFVITGFGGDHGKSYTLRQVNGALIPRSFYKDHLKPFQLCKGYLITSYEETIPAY